MNNIDKKRDYGVDLIKVVACLSVIALHYTEYYYVATTNESAYVLLHIIRWFVFGCIGLFIIATGYLQWNKNISAKFYLKLLPIVVTFLIYCIVTLIVRNPFDGTTSIFSYIWNGIAYYFFGYNGYFWYMNFFFSFYVLIPFLNLIIKYTNKKSLLLFIIILVGILIFPDFWSQIQDFSKPIADCGIRTPSYFSIEGFAFVYYFIGAYISKYVNIIKIKDKVICFIVLIASMAIHSNMDLFYMHKYQEQFELGQHVYSFNSYGGLFTVLSCTLFVLIAKNVTIHTNITKTCLKLLSSNTLEIYLGLMIADELIGKVEKMLSYSITCSIEGITIWIVAEFTISIGVCLVWKIARSGCKKIIKIFKQAIGRKIDYAGK